MITRDTDMVTQCRSEELTLSALQCPAASRVKKVKPGGEGRGGRGEVCSYSCLLCCYKYLTHSDRDVTFPPHPTLLLVVSWSGPAIVLT